MLDEGKGFVQHVNEKNEFPHPKREEPLVEEVAKIGLELEQELSVVEKKIQGILHSAEKDRAVLRRMGNSRTFIKKVVLDQRFEKLE